MTEIDNDIKNFQRDYHSCIGGKFNIKIQVTHLATLADRYRDRYLKEGEWKHCLKVRTTCLLFDLAFQKYHQSVSYRVKLCQ